MWWGGQLGSELSPLQEGTEGLPLGPDSPPHGNPGRPCGLQDAAHAPEALLYGAVDVLLGEQL